MGKSVLSDKSYDFALKVARITLELSKDKKEFTLSNQLLKSATSIGANVAEAQGCQTKKDFYAKISIAYKETLESHYWIRMFSDLELISPQVRDELLGQNEELIKIMAKIKSTIRHSLNK